MVSSSAGLILFSPMAELYFSESFAALTENVWFHWQRFAFNAYFHFLFINTNSG